MMGTEQAVGIVYAPDRARAMSLESDWGGGVEAGIARGWVLTPKAAVLNPATPITKTAISSDRKTVGASFHRCLMSFMAGFEY